MVLEVLMKHDDDNDDNGDDILIRTIIYVSLAYRSVLCSKCIRRQLLATQMEVYNLATQVVTASGKEERDTICTSHVDNNWRLSLVIVFFCLILYYAFVTVGYTTQARHTIVRHQKLRRSIIWIYVTYQFTVVYAFNSHKYTKHESVKVRVERTKVYFCNICVQISLKSWLKPKSFILQDTHTHRPLNTMLIFCTKIQILSSLNITMFYNFQLHTTNFLTYLNV